MANKSTKADKVKAIQPAAEVKTEAVAAPAVEEKKPAEMASAKKTETKTEKKAPEKKTEKKSAEKVEKLFYEVNGNKYETADIIEMCKAAYKNGTKKQIKSIEVYVNDGKAYYVVNGKSDGQFVQL